MAAACDPHVEVAPVGAVIIPVDGAPPVGGVLDDLRREVLDVELGALDLIDAREDAEIPSVCVFWMPAHTSGALLDEIVAWGSENHAGTGLIGCAPYADNDEVERGLAAGFDDFVAGAISTRELAARIRAIHRRVHWTGLRRPGRLRWGPVTLNTDGHELWLDGRTVILTSTELAVFRALMRARGKTLTRTEILDRAWGDTNLEVSERAVDNVILRLRRKIAKPGLIQTVRGVGFRLASD